MRKVTTLSSSETESLDKQVAEFINKYNVVEWEIHFSVSGRYAYAMIVYRDAGFAG